MTDDIVLFQTNENGVASITLNQPKSLNALTLDMLILIRDKLKEWQTDDSVQVVILKGAGPKGFCSGGDMKAIYQIKEKPTALEAAERFFEVEYETDALVASFPKPIVAFLDGIVMGGGIGLSYGASHRIVTDQTKWAMPEMNLAFFPDVGAAYFLNRAPGFTGRYLALTSSTLKAADVLYINAADYYVPSDRISDVQADIEANDWHHENRVETLSKLLYSHVKQPNEAGKLTSLQSKIDRSFSLDTVENIVEALEESNSRFANETKDTILLKSPVSLKVTLAQLIKGQGQTLETCLEMDLILAKNFLRHDDFYEGVRSVLIDKDQQPEYEYKQLRDVSRDIVESFFNA